MVVKEKNFDLLTHNTSQLVELIKSERVFKEHDSLTDHLENLEVTLKQLENQEYSIAVIAAMKAGKSTLLNAFLGNDILPNEVDACTASITEIKNGPKFINKVEKIYRNGKKEEIFSNSEQTLGEAFHEDVKNARKNNAIADIERYKMEAPIVSLGELNQESGDITFLLVDTPGTNEAQLDTIDINALKENTYYQLRHANAVIFVFDYTSYKSETNVNLLNDIFSNRDDLKKDLNKVFFLVNKIDMRDLKDGDVNHIVENVKDVIKSATNNLIETPQVLPVSAMKALQGRRLLLGTLSVEERQQYEKKYAGLYGETIEYEGEELIRPLKGEKLGHALLKDSYIQNVEKTIIIDTFENAMDALYIESVNAINARLEKLLGIIEYQKIWEEDRFKGKESEIQQAQKQIKELATEAEDIKLKLDSSRSIYSQDIEKIIAELEGELKNTVSNLTIDYNDKYEFDSQEESMKKLNDIRAEINNHFEAAFLENQDILSRKDEEFQKEVQKISESIIQGVALKANQILEDTLDLKIETFDYVDTKTKDYNISFDYLDIELKKSSRMEIDDNSMWKRAATGAATGAAAGRFAGPYGMVAVGLAGFVVGALLTEEKEVPTYIIDMKDVKNAALKEIEKQMKYLQKQIDEEHSGNMNLIMQGIEGKIRILLNAVENNLNKLENNLTKTEEERDNEINYLTNVENELQHIHKSIN